MKKRVLLIATLMAFLGTLHAQRQPLLSQYMLNNYYLNPAYSGSGERLSFTFLHRTEWAGYKDYSGQNASPQTQLFEISINPDNTAHNAGFQFVRDKLGAIRSHGIQLSYAYRIPVSEKSTLALGIRGGVTSKTIDFGKYIVIDPDDPLLAGRGKQSETKPDFTLGTWYEHEKYYAGISARGIVTQANYEKLNIQNDKLITITGGYHFKLVNTWTLTPSIQMVTNTKDTFVDTSVLVKNENRFWGGLSYRHEEAATLLLGIGMIQQRLRLSYALDYVTGNRDVEGYTSHEIMLRYCAGELHRKQ